MVSLLLTVFVRMAFGYVDMCKGIDGLAMLVKGVLRQDTSPTSVRVPRPEGQFSEDRVMVGVGLCLFNKRLEDGVFLWPRALSQSRRCL